MSNDPKDTVVDRSKLTKNSNPLPPKSKHSKQPGSLITSLNEEKDLTGYENFSRKSKKAD